MLCQGFGSCKSWPIYVYPLQVITMHPCVNYMTKKEGIKFCQNQYTLFHHGESHTFVWTSQKYLYGPVNFLYEPVNFFVWCQSKMTRTYPIIFAWSIQFICIYCIILYFYCIHFVFLLYLVGSFLFLVVCW